MASSMAAKGKFPSLSHSSSGRRRSKLPSSYVPTLTTATTLIIRCQHQNPKPSKPSSTHSPSKTLISITKNVAISAASGILFHLAYNNIPSLLLGGSGGGSAGAGGGGGGGGVGGGGGSGGPGDGWSRTLCPAANADESKSQEWDRHGLPAKTTLPFSKFSALKRYKISVVKFYDIQIDDIVKSSDSFFEMVSLRPGGIYTKAQLEAERDTLANCGMFEKVEMEGWTRADGTIALTIKFTESKWQVANRFKCINVGSLKPSQPIDEMDPDMTQREIRAFIRRQEREYQRRIAESKPCLLPQSVVEDLSGKLSRGGSVTARTLQSIRDEVQKWYHDQGYACAQVVNFGNLNTKEVVCEVVEGDITKVDIQFLDKLGNICEGNTQLSVINREMPAKLSRGQLFNIEDGKQALRNINSLALFSNIEVNPRPDEKNEGAIIVEIKLKELEQKSAEVSSEWSIVPGRGGRPTLASIQPGGTVSFEHRNLQGLNRSVLGSVTTSNFLNPQDDLAFKLEYVHPYLDGIRDRRDRTLRASVFNSRKLSPVFTGGPGVDEVPPIWVDRAGVKANITESFTRQSKFTYGLVMEEITTRDESSNISANGQRVLPSGGISADGPPTTLSGTGIDRMAFAQANITRDNTKFVNGAIVGDRNVFQLDQGLGIGSKFPFFNRHQLTVTRFIQLKKRVEEGAGKPPPPVLVLHGHYGGCVGDLPSYDAFTLGGPYSVRGYNMGEIGAARNILEVAAELRVPVRNTHMYAFAEHGNDLWSSKDVKGNPTEVYRRVGHGSSYGVGLKLGLVRAEYAVDHNSGTGAIFFRFGERF